MEYVNMIKTSKAKGYASEEKMWQSIDAIGKNLEELKCKHPQMYWKIMRQQHGILFNHHYDKEFAEYDVSQLHYTNARGEKRVGAHWTIQQILDATSNVSFPSGVNEYDKYVAYNATYADLCSEIPDEVILKVAYLQYFDDEDWSEDGSSTKIWEYMCLRSELNEG